jgi:hypothetical protein
MRLTCSTDQPWTRAHEKFAKAWGDLAAATSRIGAGNLEHWLYVRWGVRRIRELTPAQARCASRQVNAWRSGIQHGTPCREYPRQWRRNRRRVTAYKTAASAGGEFENLIRGTALEALGGLVVTDSPGKSR